nr:hypothetical protein [Mycoplasmopsis bovis]
MKYSPLTRKVKPGITQVRYTANPGQGKNNPRKVTPELTDQGNNNTWEVTTNLIKVK